MKKTLMNRRGMSLSLQLTPTEEQLENEKEKEQDEAQDLADLAKPMVGDPRKRSPRKKIDPKKFLSGGALCPSPEQKQRAALPVNLLSTRRLLPGAFPTRRTVLFFDWDDTLCPTTWIR